MKRKKTSFNYLLLKYNKYVKKLNRFQLTGRNERRQDVLITHIERLKEKLDLLIRKIKKASAIAALSATMVAVAPNISAQNIQFAGTVPLVENPNNLTNVGYQTTPIYVDIDNDGDLDLFVGEYSGTINFFENIGTISNPDFDVVQQNPFGISGLSGNAAIDFVDIDNDGVLDMFIGEYTGNFKYFHNSGSVANPVFDAPVLNPFNLVNVVNYATVSFADIDNDGDFDMLSGSSNGDFEYFENIGTSSVANFAAMQTNAMGLVNIGSRSYPRFVDIDNDNDLDIIAGESLGDFYYFENTGTNSVPVYPSYIVNNFGLKKMNSYSTPDFGDIDNDGNFDLISGSSSGNLYTFDNTGDDLNADFSPVNFIINPFNLDTLDIVVGGDLKDLDNDGDLDLLTGSGYGGFFDYFENIGDNNNPNFDTKQHNPFGLEDTIYLINQPNLVDLDNDGDLDILTNGYYGDFYYYENIGTESNPVYDTAQVEPFNLDGYYDMSTIADIDNDGDFDIISLQRYTNYFLFYENIGSVANPDFAPKQTNVYGTSPFAGGYLYRPYMSDIDFDGDLDMFIGSDGLYYMENIGTAEIPNFGSIQKNPFGLKMLEDIISSPILSDIDKDGDLDLLSGSYFGNFYYFQNYGTNTDPNFTKPESVTNPFGLSNTNSKSSPAFVDLDNDGDFDVMYGYYGTSGGNINVGFKYFENIGNSSNPNFAVEQINPFSITIPSSFYTVKKPTFADLDNDGDLDMISGTFYGEFLYYENTGDNSNPSFAASLLNAFNLTDIGSSSSPTLVDIDNDGDFDLFSGEYTDDINYFENTGTPSSPNFAVVQTNVFNLNYLLNSSTPSFNDIDKDGDFDLFLGANNGNFVYYENIGNNIVPNFTIPLLNGMNLHNIGNSSAPTLADLDGDGDADLLTGSNTGDFIYFENISSIFCAEIENTDTKTACNSYTWINGQTYTADNNTATMAYPLMNGCDSIITLDLTVTHLAIEVVQSGNVLVASTGLTNYQWYDDSGAISGATDVSYTPTENGSFYCESTIGECSEVSNTVTITGVGIANVPFSSYSVYPNPVDKTLNLQVSEVLNSIQLLDITGKIIKKYDSSSTELDVSDFSKGIYLLEIANDYKKSTIKIIVK